MDMYNISMIFTIFYKFAKTILFQKIPYITKLSPVLCTFSKIRLNALTIHFYICVTGNLGIPLLQLHYLIDAPCSNDLTTETPELVATRYESLLRLLENKIRPRRIIILSLVYRKDVQKWKVDKLNVSLKQFQSNIVHFWKLDRVGGDNNIGPDGIHLNERGMMNFKRNIFYSLKCTK
ncbi:hypothetical protein HELRODRAFT_176261 [Helobdella robusta]|uniref:Uncharacterized protein n=1 Tax=Helobdella robusta TaxID=6412 RepID=T1FAC3_HELRO|nr:hypothetical protein HELRODRAFT_176261 [Helobdella robusta]ESN99961.1 hypothetical protein HELRODRAFT_176261 [Helobdella robusta]